MRLFTQTIFTNLVWPPPFWQRINTLHFSSDSNYHAA